MLAISQALKTRLTELSALTGWAVRLGTDGGDRRPLPAVDVRCGGASVPSVKGAGVLLQPEWMLTIATRRSSEAAAQIDAVLSAVIESLHGWQPGSQGGRGWEPMQISRVTEALFTEEGIAGYELTFTTAARYMGQQ